MDFQLTFELWLCHMVTFHKINTTKSFADLTPAVAEADQAEGV